MTTGRAENKVGETIGTSSSRDEVDPSVTPHRAPDYLFPRGGGFSISASTGVPFVAITEVAYGFSDWGALGLIAGVTPRVAGFGVRPRVSLLESAAFRAVVAAPVIYYPRTNGFGNEPWILTNPTLVGELTLADDWRVHAGVGIIAAGCVDEIFDPGDHDDPMGLMGGVWNTLPFGAAYQFNRNWSVFVDAQLILKGIRFAGADWVGGPPFSTGLGMTRQL